MQLSSYHYPDKTMQKIAGVDGAEDVSHDNPINALIGLLREGLMWHASEYDPKKVVAQAFGNNTPTIVKPAAKRPVQQATLRIAYTHPKMVKFGKEIDNIVNMPLLTSFANNNVGGKSTEAPKIKDILPTAELTEVKPVWYSTSNVVSMEDWLSKLRNAS